MIRKFMKNDIDQVIQLWLSVNIKAHDFIPETYWVEQMNKVKEMLPQSELYVYVDNGIILGFVGLIDDYIAGIFVSNDAQEKGIGKRLLNYIKDIKTELSLSVYKKNERAIQFYERENFLITSSNIDDNTKEHECFMLWKR